MGQSVLMECDILGGNPSPAIQWYADNRLQFNQVSSPPAPKESEVLYLESGRYLFIRALTASQRRYSYWCEVTNALINIRIRGSATYVFEEQAVEASVGRLRSAGNMLKCTQSLELIVITLIAACMYL